MDNSTRTRTIGFHPCVGKKASGEERPTTVVIRETDGSHAAYELVEQQLLDLFTCGAVVAWRDATLDDLAASRPPHHERWVESDAEAYAAYVLKGPEQRGVEITQLFRALRKKTTDEIIGYLRLQVPEELVMLNPATDTIGVANGGLGCQIIEILLGRYPDMDVRTIGSGTLKEGRVAFDQLLPKPVRRKAERIRATATDADVAVDVVAEDEDDDGEAPSKSAAKDANAKYDAHRIAYALADDAAAKAFHCCTLRDRDWAAVNVAYRSLEVARNARVAAEQQFRQIHRAELRRLAKDPRVPYATLGAGDEDDRSIKALLASYEATLRIVVTKEQDVAKRLAALLLAHVRIIGARTTEHEMERHLDAALEALPEYTEFLAHAKAQVHPKTGLPLGRYIGARIFGRWIAGFGSPMSSRISEPMRPTDVERIAACRVALTEAIAVLDRTGLPAQPEPGSGKTREWLLMCERVLSDRLLYAPPYVLAERAPIEQQLA